MLQISRIKYLLRSGIGIYFGEIRETSYVNKKNKTISTMVADKMLHIFNSAWRIRRNNLIITSSCELFDGEDCLKFFNEKLYTTELIYKDRNNYSIRINDDIFIDFFMEREIDEDNPFLLEDGNLNILTDLSIIFPKVTSNENL